jgi:hypothetical protein
LVLLLVWWLALQWPALISRTTIIAIGVADIGIDIIGAQAHGDQDRGGQDHGDQDHGVQDHGDHILDTRTTIGIAISININSCYSKCINVWCFEFKNLTFFKVLKLIRVRSFYVIETRFSWKSVQSWQKSAALIALMRAFFVEFNADIQLNTQFKLQKDTLILG